MKSFTELIAWQKARQVRKSISVLVRAWRAEEKFRLVDQIIRSSRGPCANLAEGYGRFHERDNARFCRMARGSLYETLDHLSVAHDEGYIDAGTLRSHWALVEEAIRVLNGYIGYLQRLGITDGVSEPAASYGDDVPIFRAPPADVSLGVEEPDAPSPEHSTITLDNGQPASHPRILTTDN